MLSMTPAAVLMVFIDGIGLAPTGPDNPFSPSFRDDDASQDGFGVWAAGHSWTTPAPNWALEEQVFTGVDACLGVPGLPQSGTGQATLFTGINCARVAGRHFGPWPHSSTRGILRDSNVFKRVKDRTGRDAAFANAFPDVFFERSERTNRWSTTTRCCLDSGTRLRTLEDLASGNALPADITGAGLRRFMPSLIARGEEEAADHLLAVAQRHAFTLFEYFATDKAGHAQSREHAFSVLRSLSRFLHRLHRQRPAGMTIVISSDHGNLEDLSVRTHTRNPVPLVAAGPGARCFGGIKDLTGVVDGVLRVFDQGLSDNNSSSSPSAA